MDSPGDLLGVCDRDVQIDAWMGLAKRRDAWRQPIIRDGLAGCQGQRAALEAGQIVQDLRGRLGARHDLACLLQEVPSGLGPMPRPMRSNSLIPYRASSAAIAALVA